MTNPKIEKIDAAIEKEKAALEKRKAKLRELQNQRKDLVDEEILAMFRRENLSEDDIAALKRMKAKTKGASTDAQNT